LSNGSMALAIYAGQGFGNVLVVRYLRGSFSLYSSQYEQQ
jgi:hypothetical protein